VLTLALVAIPVLIIIAAVLLAWPRGKGE